MAIKEDFVSFETAKLLKEKGFDEPTIGTYYKDGTFEHLTINRWNSKFVTPISAPTLQMAMKWLRKEHNIDILITIGGFVEKGKVYFCSVYKNLINYGDLKEYLTYEEAAEAGIKYCLENIID